MEFYNEIYSFTSSLLDKHRRRDMFCEEEIISMVYIQIYDTGMDFTIDNFRKLITTNIKYSVRNGVEISEMKAVYDKKTAEVGNSNFYKYCTCCKKPKTKDDFYSYLHKKGINKGLIQEWTECKECRSNKSKSWLEKKLEVDPLYIKKASKKYVESGNYREYKRNGRLKLDNWYLVEIAHRELKKRGMDKISRDEYIFNNSDYLDKLKKDILEKRKQKQLAI